MGHGSVVSSTLAFWGRVARCLGHTCRSFALGSTPSPHGVGLENNERELLGGPTGSTSIHGSQFGSRSPFVDLYNGMSPSPISSESNDII